MRSGIKGNLVIIMLIISYYLFWELRSIELPALEPDEDWPVMMSYTFITNEPPRDCGTYVNIFKKRIPIATSPPYHGACMMYLLIPFILFGGLNIYSVRMLPISFGAVTVFLLFQFCKKFLKNEIVSFITACLLAIDISFIISTKVGLTHGSMIGAFLLGSLLCFLEWYEKKINRYFYIGSFLTGMGLFTKAWFLWYVIGLIAILIVFFRKWQAKFTKKEISVTLVGGALSFCIAISPLIYYESKTSFSIVKFCKSQISQTRYGYHNLRYFRNLLDRVYHLKELPSAMQRGVELSSNKQAANLIKGCLNGFYFYLFILSLIWHGFTIIFKRKKFLIQRKVLLTLFFTMFLLTPFSLSTAVPEHLLILLPIMKIITGIFIYEFMNLLLIAKLTTAFLLIILLGAQTFNLQSYHSSIDETGGVGLASDAIYKVVNDLVLRDRKDVVLMDANLAHHIFVLSGGKVEEKFLFFVKADGVNFNDEVLEKCMTEELENRNNVYLFRSREFRIVDSFDWFSKLAEKQSKRVREMEKFYQRDGRLAYILYEVI